MLEGLLMAHCACSVLVLTLVDPFTWYLICRFPLLLELVTGKQERLLPTSSSVDLCSGSAKPLLLCAVLPVFGGHVHCVQATFLDCLLPKSTEECSKPGYLGLCVLSLFCEVSFESHCLLRALC